MLHFTLPHIDMADPQVHKIVACAQESFRVHHTGFHWQAIYLENCAAFHDVHRESGFFRAALPTRLTLDGLPDPLRPVFMASHGVTRPADACLAPTLRNCFNAKRPVLFSPSKRLAGLCLTMPTPAAIPALGVSVRKAQSSWRGIYERVMSVGARLLCDDAGDDPPGWRGPARPEKRRRGAWPMCAST